MNIILKIKEILNSNDTEKKISVVVSLILISISSIFFIFNLLFNNSIIVAIFLGVFDSSSILFLLMILNCKKNMTGRNRRGIPITKDNVIYARICVCLIPSLFILFGIFGILNNNNKVFQTEAKIISINPETKIIQGQNHTQFNYKIEYTINNVKYNDTIITDSLESASSNTIQPSLKVGDTKTIVVYNNKYTDKDYKTLSDESQKGNLVCIFFICFATIIGCAMLYGINQSIED